MPLHFKGLIMQWPWTALANAIIIILSIVLHDRWIQWSRWPQFTDNWWTGLIYNVLFTISHCVTHIACSYCTINRRHFHISHCILQIHAERFVKSHKQRHVSDDLNKIKVAVECHQGRVSARIKDGTCGWRLHYAGLYLGLWIGTQGELRAGLAWGYLGSCSGCAPE